MVPSPKVFAQEDFTTLKAKLNRNIEQQPEQEIIKLLELGLREMSPAQASAVAESWLKHNLPDKPRLLYLLGRNAEMGGNWREASASYQQFLIQAGPESNDASDAITGLHGVLVDQLRDIDGAYSFYQRAAIHLAPNSRFRQIGDWFTAEAQRRTDLQGMTDFLIAMGKSGASGDYLELNYLDDLIWLNDQLDNIRYDVKPTKVTADLVNSTAELPKLHGLNEELSMLIAWQCACIRYNLDILEDKQAQAPTNLAKQLLAKYPEHAPTIQTDWAGNRVGPYYRGDVKKYWSHQLEGKLPPIQQALGRLGDLDQLRLLETWSHQYYGRDAQVVSPEDSRNLALNSPQLVNQIFGPQLGFDWTKLTLEQAKTLSAKLDKSPAYEAAAIRAMAFAGETKDFDKAMEHLIKHEGWRLEHRNINHILPDQLWHWAGRPGGSAKRDQAIKRFNDELRRQLIGDEKKVQAMPANKREQEFRRLWKDLKSGKPSITDVVGQTYLLAKHTPKAVELLLADDSLEARWLCSRLLNDRLKDGNKDFYDYRAGTLSPHRFNPYYWIQSNYHGGVERIMSRDDLKHINQPHPLLPALSKALERQLRANKLESWAVMSWINAQYPGAIDKHENLAMRLVKAGSWKDFSSQIHYGMAQRFPKVVYNASQQKIRLVGSATDACESLLALTPESSAADAVEAMKATTDNVLKAPRRIQIIGTKQLGALKDEVWADSTFQTALADMISNTRMGNADEDPTFGNKLQTVADQGDTKFILPTAAYQWVHVERHHRTLPAAKALANRITEKNPEAASALSRIGLQVIARHSRGHTWFKREEDIPMLKAIRGKTALQMGLVEIPVPANHPNYPVYLAQAEWMTENRDSAWRLIDGNWDVFTSIHRELSFSFLMWILDRSIQTRDSNRQQELIKSLLSWTSEAGSSLRPSEKGEVEIAYGDIAVQRGQLREAGEIFNKIKKSEAYKNEPIRYVAALRRVRVDRLAKNFDGALQLLTELEMERLPTLWSDIRFARAQVNFDREEYEDCADDIQSIFTREPNHPDAKILLGKVQLKRQKLMEATELEIGSTSSQQNIVPGERLKVTLADPTLEVSGAGTEIEVVVWANSGDREQFFLRQFGDQKTKFRGEVDTELGAPNEGDGILQVIGDDEVFYAYSERFRTKMNGLEEKRGGPIRIASDATLMASARKLLSEAEQRRADMQQVMQEIGDGNKNQITNLEGAARAELANQAIRGMEEGYDPTIANAERNIFQIAKPGNPIHIRVVDKDRSRTAEIDELQVSVAVSSGDSISSITLRETETHSGWFEGSIPTAGASARAMASSSEPGRNPNMVISPNNSYPSWRPIASPNNPQYEFTIDLNDRVDLGRMVVTAEEKGAKLKSFLLQTGMNSRDMTTIGIFPENIVAIEKPWHPSVTIIQDADRYHNNNGRKVHDGFSEIRHQMDRGWVTQRNQTGVAENVAGISEAFKASIHAKKKWLRDNRHHNSHVIYRFRGHFHENSSTTRRFKLELGQWKPAQQPHSSVSHPPEFLLAVNGRPITDPTQLNKLEGSINLQAGINTFEIWATGWDCMIGFGRNVKLFANTENPEGWTELSDSFFDPSTFPVSSMDHRNAPASITANDDGTTFDVDFAKNSKARLIRLLPIQSEGPVPELNKITLSKPDGEKVLPIAGDYAELNKNQILEILTGDRIYVRYRDDRFVTPANERLERFLNVSFTDARIAFADMEPRPSGGEMKPYFEELIRFRHGKALDLAIRDADMDSTVEPDSIEVTLGNGSTKVTMTATETGDSTGIFRLRIVPVTGAPKEGQFQVPVGGTITASYMDTENNRPGVPTERYTTIGHAKFVQPEFIVSNAEVSPWEPLEEGDTPPLRTLHQGFEPNAFFDNVDNPRDPSERILTRWRIHHTPTPTKNLNGPAKTILGQPMYVEVIAPQFALGKNSNVKVYAQTESGRKAAGGATGGAFDISIPGTIEVGASLFNISGMGLHHHLDAPILQSYTANVPASVRVSSQGNPSKPAYDRFFSVIHLVPGVLPEYGVLSRSQIEDMNRLNSDSRSASEIRGNLNSLVAKAGETIHIGFKYADQNGKVKWLTTTAKAATHPCFDIMSEDYRKPLTAAYAGEYLSLRVVDLGADLTDEHDTTNVLMQAKSGAKYMAVLTETGPHTGIFKQAVKLSYTKDPSTLPEQLNVASEGFPITYGDTVAARYTDLNGIKTEVYQVSISKGADGMITPFSKQYEDEDVAMRTQFSLAEAYLEMAKRHRLLGQQEKADLEYASAKLLLSKAMDQFTEPNTRAHAEYLLGTLTMEEADTATDAEIKETRFRAALSRFMNVTGTYPDSLHASRAQYRIANVYEKLDEPEIAAQEYVKLAYKYPDSEYLATSMGKLGSHFLKKAATHEAQAKPLLAKADEDKDAAFEGEVLQKLAEKEYIKTANIFGRLQERFPDNRLAGRAGIQAGQSFMRAKKYREAIAMFKRVIDEENYDGPKERAAGIFWSGMCYQEIRMEMAAYSAYKRLTYDFPESQWAAYARAKLSEERMLNLEENLEIERLESGK
ncbi:MAG: tetratricopeptide repeat protein [Luteolibacter sp.]